MSLRRTLAAPADELAAWLELSPLPMLMFELPAGRLLRFNGAFARLCTPPGPPDRLALLPPALQQLLGWEGVRAGDALLQCQDELPTRADLPGAEGRRIWMQGRVRPLGDGRCIAVLEDRSAEQERDLAHQQLDALMDTAGVGLATFQQDAGWLRPPPGASGGSGGGGGNSALASLQGVGRDIVEPASMPEFERLQQALKSGERIEVRYAVRHPELGRRWLLTRVEPGRLASGQRTTSVVTLDVTAQQQAERRSELLLHELTTIMNGAGLGLAYLRGSALVRCNGAFAALLGLAGPPSGGAPVAALFAGQPQLGERVQQALPGLAPERSFEAEFQREDGRWIALTLRRVSGEGPLQAETVAVLSDITRLKSQQSELEALVRDRELMFSLSDVGIAILRHGRIARANDALAELTGYRIHELDGLPHHALFDSEAEYRQQQALVRQALEDSGQWQGERRVRRRDGTGLWMQISQRAMRAGAPDEGQIATFVNVDDRWRAQQSLILQTERERTVLDSVMVGIVTVGRGGIQWMNRSARRMFGGDLAEFLGQQMALVATDDPAHPFRQSAGLLQSGESQVETFECRIKARDGREFWVVGNAVVTGTEAGRQLTYALLDIERRRQAEAQTQQAQTSLRRIIEAAPLAISLHDADTLDIAQANPAAALFGAAAGPQLREDMAAALEAPGSAVIQHEYRLGDGPQMRVWDARFLRLAGTDTPDQLLLVASDVTEHRAAEQARLEAAISQRELLVREVHHRIKNNLQGVAGLLQQIATRRPEVAGIISEAVGQVNAIAQVYGLQVGAQGPLRVHKVLEAIVGSVQRVSGRRIATDLGDAKALALEWALPEAESIPIALTLNELLTNAIKHSPDSEVRCRLLCAADSVAVEIDNPGRLPPGFDVMALAGGVSGLGLVRALLPRRSALLDLTQQGDRVVARVELWPPSIMQLPEHATMDTP
ncbi:PAS domain S-box protein [Pelomonas sp. KK5]|uniref:PAS domain S-box protein n=1 Tax=Pelomonas sp. KK5 TaxID=1855730 RepID=UPI00097CBEF6|nr:PAS domain S-box protein [Pelomonas sp. KK5]